MRPSFLSSVVSRIREEISATDRLSLPRTSATRSRPATFRAAVRKCACTMGRSWPNRGPISSAGKSSGLSERLTSVVATP
eukprot:scaffold218497_cov22-Prasinocladus_malaysianus.AAC.3